MPLLKLKPAVKDYIWGGHRLVDEYHVDYDGPVAAEAWVLSCHPDGPSVITGGEYDGMTLPDYIHKFGRSVLGTNCDRFQYFPVLTKLIDAHDNLSVQVHPDNYYAMKNEHQYGKTEMWYIVDAEPGAFLYYGFEREISMDEFEERIRDNTLTEALHKEYVHKGDELLIESGTIHAIGKGILIAEIQQNSNVTYRVYDYGRLGKDGKPRALNIGKALDVTKREPVKREEFAYPHVEDCDYFTVDKSDLNGRFLSSISGDVDSTSFMHLLILDGEGIIEAGADRMSYRKGNSFFLPAGSGHWEIKGSVDALVTTIRSKDKDQAKAC